MMTEMQRPLPKGMLVAVMSSVNPKQIRRIARVVEDRGAPWLVTVETDDELEGEAAVEYDFPTPEPAILEVDFDRLRPILDNRK